jgi:hypothetical protein
MKRTGWLQDRGMQKFRDVLSRWDGDELSTMEAGALLGMSERLPALARPLRRGNLLPHA